jgi:adenosylmethionine-8-amino-7-oxononanoate aminotransferase
VLNILEEQQLVPRVAALGTRLLDRLEPLRQFPIVGDIRGKGLLVGIELVVDRATRRPLPLAARAGQAVLQACLDRGLAIYPSSGSVDGTTGDNILLAPPYIITEAQIDELVEKLTQGIEHAQYQLLGPNTCARRGTRAGMGRE